MIRIKNTGRSLFISFLIVILCFSALGGASYALFTYEEPAANVIIQAGDVMVDMQDAQGVSLENRSLIFRDRNGSAKISWEPGATFLSDPFFVKNLGDTTLNFRILLEGAGMDSMEFLNAFEVSIVDKDGNTVDLSKYQQELRARESSDEFRIRAKMRESVGNEYNKPSGHSFGGIIVTVYAIQGNVDAFTKDPIIK